MTDLLCKCGRSVAKVHCPHCGRTSRIYCYAPSRRLDKATREDGTTVQLRVYRCQACGLIFNDDDWQLRCIAPTANITKGNAGALLDYAKQKARATLVAEEFGGDYDAHRHSLFPKQDKLLRPIAGSSTIPDSEKSMSDEEAEAALRELNEELAKKEENLQ